MLFLYKAYRNDGKKIKGYVDLEDERELGQYLQNQSYILLSFKKADYEKIQLHKKEIIAFTKELSKLLLAGLSLYEALYALSEKYQDNKLSYVFSLLCEQIKRGLSFSEALEKFHRNFDLFYRSMIYKAELSGTLQKTLEEIAQFLSKEQTFKKKIISSVLYPGFLFGFSIIIFICLLFFVIPSLFDLFDGRTLHPFTAFVFCCSQWALNNKGILLAVFLLLAGLIFVSAVSNRIKRQFYRIFLRIRFIKPLAIKISLIRYSRSLSALLSGGIAFYEAAQLSKTVLRHPFLEIEFSEAERNIIEGKKFSDSLKNKRFIPPLFIRMVSVAEESGNLEHSLLHIADLYEEEMNQKVALFLTVLQPVLLLILGCIIGFVVLSVLLPMTDVSSFMSN